MAALVPPAIVRACVRPMSDVRRFCEIVRVFNPVKSWRQFFHARSRSLIDDHNKTMLVTYTMPLHQPNTFPSIGTKVYLDMPVVMRDPSLMANERTQQSLSKWSRDAAQHHDTNINDYPPHSLSPLRTLENGELSLEDASNELFAILTYANKKYSRFTAEDLRREMETMTEQERTAILSDIFGDMCSLGARLKRPEPGLVDPLIVKDGTRDCSNAQRKQTSSRGSHGQGRSRIC
jgi:hypothetical protein